MSTGQHDHESTGTDATARTRPPDLGSDGVDRQAHTRRLLSRLTALADRFDAAAPTDRAEPERRRRETALMRSVAESESRRVPHAAASQANLTPAGSGEAGDRRRELGNPGTGGTRPTNADATEPTPPAIPDGWVVGFATAQVAMSEALSVGAHLDERRAVQQAQGILMARRGCTAAAAFEAMLLACQEHGLSLNDLAAQVVLDAATGPAPGAATGDLHGVPAVPAAGGAGAGTTNARPAEVVVRPPVEIDMATVGLLEDQLRAACALRPDRVIVECAHVAFSDCCVVTALLEASITLRNRGSRLVVRHPNRNLQLMIDHFDLEEVLGVPPYDLARSSPDRAQL